MKTLEKSEWNQVQGDYITENCSKVVVKSKSESLCKADVRPHYLVSMQERSLLDTILVHIKFVELKILCLAKVFQTAQIGFSPSFGLHTMEAVQKAWGDDKGYERGENLKYHMKWLHILTLNTWGGIKDIRSTI